MNLKVLCDGCDPQEPRAEWWTAAGRICDNRDLALVTGLDGPPPQSQPTHIRGTPRGVSQRVILKGRVKAWMMGACLEELFFFFVRCLRHQELVPKYRGSASQIRANTMSRLDLQY